MPALGGFLLIARRGQWGCTRTLRAGSLSLYNRPSSLAQRKPTDALLGTTNQRPVVCQDSNVFMLVERRYGLSQQMQLYLSRPDCGRPARTPIFVQQTGGFRVRPGTVSKSIHWTRKSPTWKSSRGGKRRLISCGNVVGDAGSEAANHERGLFITAGCGPR